MSNAIATPAPARPAGNGRVLDFKSGQAFLPAVGSVIRTDAPEWTAAATAASVQPGVYRVALHVISTEPNRAGKVSRNAGKDTVRLTPVGTVADATAAVAAARARLAEAEAMLKLAQANPVAAPVKVAAPPRPSAAATAAPVAAPDIAAIVAAAVAQAMAAAQA